MLHYIIDGNNLIGTIPRLKKLQQKDKHSSRNKLAHMIDDYFTGKKVKVTIHFDGYENVPIKLQNAKIVYSKNRKADKNIREQIENEKNRKNLVVVSSDIKDIVIYAKKCSCNVVSSEEFAKQITTRQSVPDEEKIIEKLKNDEDWLKLFNDDE